MHDIDTKLRIFAGSEHPLVDRSLDNYAMSPRQVCEMRPRAKSYDSISKKAGQQEQDETDTKKGKRQHKVGAFLEI